MRTSNHSKKLSGVVEIERVDSSKIPSPYQVHSWDVASDRPEGKINLAKLDFSSSPFRRGDLYLSGYEIMGRAPKSACGSIGFVVRLLQEQERGKEIFPRNCRKVVFAMPRVQLKLEGGRSGILCFYYNSGLKKWGPIACLMEASHLPEVRFVTISD